MGHVFWFWFLMYSGTVCLLSGAFSPKTFFVCVLAVVMFLNYILLIMLLELSWFFPLCPPPPSTPPLLQAVPHSYSCPWVMRVSSLAAPFPTLDSTSPRLFCNYLFVLLSPLTSSIIPTYPPPIWQPSKCSLYPCFCLRSSLLSLFFRFNC